MSTNIPRIISTDFATFSGNTAKRASDLYLLTDCGQLFLGESHLSKAVISVSAIPEEPLEGSLYMVGGTSCVTYISGGSFEFANNLEVQEIKAEQAKKLEHMVGIQVVGSTVNLSNSYNTYTVKPTDAVSLNFNLADTDIDLGASFYLILDFSDGVYTVTFPDNVAWVGGSAPEIASKNFHIFKVTYSNLGQTAYLLEYLGRSARIYDLSSGIWYYNAAGKLDTSVCEGQEYIMAISDADGAISGGTFLINNSASVSHITISLLSGDYTVTGGGSIDSLDIDITEGPLDQEQHVFNLKNNFTYAVRLSSIDPYRYAALSVDGGRIYRAEVYTGGTGSLTSGYIERITLTAGSITTGIIGARFEQHGGYVEDIYLETSQPGVGYDLYGGTAKNIYINAGNGSYVDLHMWGGLVNSISDGPESALTCSVYGGTIKTITLVSSDRGGFDLNSGAPAPDPVIENIYSQSINTPITVNGGTILSIFSDGPGASSVELLNDGLIAYLDYSYVTGNYGAGNHLLFSAGEVGTVILGDGSQADAPGIPLTVSDSAYIGRLDAEYTVRDPDTATKGPIRITGGTVSVSKRLKGFIDQGIVNFTVDGGTVVYLED